MTSKSYNNGTSGMYINNIISAPRPRLSQRLHNLSHIGFHLPDVLGETFDYVTHTTPELDDHQSTHNSLIQAFNPHVDLNDVKLNDLNFEKNNDDNIVDITMGGGSSNSSIGHHNVDNVNNTDDYGKYNQEHDKTKKIIDYDGSHPPTFAPISKSHNYSIPLDDERSLTEPIYNLMLLPRGDFYGGIHLRRNYLLGRQTFRPVHRTPHRYQTLFYNNEYVRNITNSVQYHTHIGQELDLNKSLISIDGQIGLYFDNDVYNNVNILYTFIQSLKNNEYIDLFDKKSNQNEGGGHRSRSPQGSNKSENLQENDEIKNLKNTLILRKTYQFINDLITNDPSYSPIPLSHYEIDHTTDTKQYINDANRSEYNHITTDFYSTLLSNNTEYNNHNDDVNDDNTTPLSSSSSSSYRFNKKASPFEKLFNNDHDVENNLKFYKEIELLPVSSKYVDNTDNNDGDDNGEDDDIYDEYYNNGENDDDNGVFDKIILSPLLVDSDNININNNNNNNNNNNHKNTDINDDDVEEVAYASTTQRSDQF